ncbi:MAG TPA: hypothetical protein VMW21_01800, partial [Patescibacteria group bacterium]|nr:hypothetical protein [Patescibacteria group bacterium]
EGVNVRYVVSGKDIQEMLDAQPELKELTDGIETYTVQGIYYDSESQRYESNVIAERIDPGTELEHQITGTHNIGVGPGVLLVSIDIKPGSYPNSINLKSKGVIPVAVLTDNFFDAKDIVIDSIVFAGANPLRGKLEDVDNDGDLDLILHFDTRSLKLTSTDTKAILSARLKDNALIKGTDSVRIVTNHKSQNSIFLAFLNVPSYLYQQIEIFLQKFTSIWMQIWGFLNNYFNQLKGKHEEISSDPCLADNEWVDYKIDEKKNAPSSAIVSIKEKNTNKQIFEFQIENIYPNRYHEVHKCGIYLVREFNFDYKKGKPLPDFRMEVWWYRYDGSGEKLVEENAFRVDPEENFLAIIQNYAGHSDYALVLKDLISANKEDVFTLPLEYITDRYPSLEGTISLIGWTKDSRYFWGGTFIAAYTLGFFRIDTTNWRAEIFPVPEGVLGGSALNIEKGYVTLHPGYIWIGIQEDYEQAKKEWQEQRKISSIYLYNLFTKEQILLATTSEPLWFFNPKWLSDNELEYELPTGEKKIYKIQQ